MWWYKLKININEMESAKRKLLANLIKETSQKLSSTEAMEKEYNQVSKLMMEKKGILINMLEESE